MNDQLPPVAVLRRTATCRAVFFSQQIVAHVTGSAENIQQAKAGAESAIRGFGEVGWGVGVGWAEVGDATAGAESR